MEGAWLSNWLRLLTLDNTTDVCLHPLPTLSCGRGRVVVYNNLYAISAYHH